MVSSRRSWLGGLVAALVFLSGEADAQTAWLELKIGQEIMVVEGGGRPLKVSIAEIGPEKLVTIRDGHSREIPITRVTRIQRGDSLRNGALIGFLAGAGFALDRLGDCEMNCYGAFVPVLGGIGAGIGILIDATRRSTTLYVEPDRAATVP